MGVTFVANIYNQTTGTRLARMLGHTEPTGSMTIGTVVNSRTQKGYQHEGIYPRVQEVGWGDSLPAVRKIQEEVYAILFCA